MFYALETHTSALCLLNVLHTIQNTRATNVAQSQRQTLEYERTITIVKMLCRSFKST